MKRIPKQEYTAEFEEQAVKQITAEQMDRHFTPDAPNCVWTGDISVPENGGW